MSLDKAATEPAEPWRSFLRELDACLTGQVELRCFGGFVTDCISNMLESRHLRPTMRAD
jgi:hypothetical protein